MILDKSHLDIVNARKSSVSRKQYLATRILLEQEDLPSHISKDNNGKPHLEAGYISITHDTDYVAIMISDQLCGIDLQSSSDKVIRIKHKFIHPEDVLPTGDELNSLILVWSIKEALYKLHGDPLVFFKEHMRINTIEKDIVKCKILHPLYLKDVTLEIRKIDNLYLAHTI